MSDEDATWLACWSDPSGAARGSDVDDDVRGVEPGVQVTGATSSSIARL